MVCIDSFNLCITINYIVLLVLMASIFIFYKKKKWFVKSLEVNKIELGLKGPNISLQINKKNQEIAYKLWVELNTRKIGLKYEEDDDVIEEVYNSWYNFFKIAREILKEMPATKIQDSYKLVELTLDILNLGLRPHLTKWQARFRQWYLQEKENNPNVTPQEIQKRYPQYEELIKDLLNTNQNMMTYTNLMKKLVFGEDISK